MEDWKTEERLDEIPNLGCFKSNDSECSSCVLFNRVVNTLARLIHNNRQAEGFIFLGYWDVKLRDKIGMKFGSILNALIQGAPPEQKDMLKLAFKQLYGEDTVNRLAPVAVIAFPKEMMN